MHGCGRAEDTGSIGELVTPAVGRGQENTPQLPVPSARPDTPEHGQGSKRSAPTSAIYPHSWLEMLSATSVVKAAS